jgi:Gpi18-like mannosyltransferase
MKIILWILTVILFILCLQVNVLTSPGQLKDSVNFYQSIHFIYLGVFLLLSAVIYMKINRRQPAPQLARPTATPKPGARKKEKLGLETQQPRFNRAVLCLTGILCAGFLLRTIIAVTFPGHPYDIQAFIHWSAAASRNLSGIYTDPNIPPRFTLTYPPVYLYVLGVIGNLIRFFQVNSSSVLLILLKLPAIIADMVTGYLLYRFAKKSLSLSMSLFIVWLSIFNPVTIFNSALWGQVDSFLTLFIMIGLLLIDAGRLPWASALFVLALLTKPQGVFVLPVLFWELFQRKKLREFLWSGLAGLITFGLVILPFSLERGPFWIVQQFTKTAKQFPFATVNAYNLYALLGANLKYDSGNFLRFNYYTWGFIFILGLLGLGTYLYRNNRKRENPRNGLPFLAGLLLSAGIFVLATRMHERYLFAALAIALLVYIRFPDRRVLYLFAAFTVTNYLNIAKICFDAFHQNAYGPDWMVPLVSLANVLGLIYLVKIAIDWTRSSTVPAQDLKKARAVNS